MTRLKILLQSNKIYYCLLIATILYVGIKVKIGYTSKINVNEDFTGIVTTIVKKENSFKLNIKGKEKLIVYISNIENIELGDKVVVKGEYTLPKKATIPNNFDYQKYLYNNHIFYIMYAKELKIIKKNQNITFKIKKYILDKTSNYTNNGYLNAFIIGDKTDLEFYETYQNNGISHLFALSGMHISMLSLIIYKLVNKFKHKDLIVIMFLLFYITLTNFSASILRTIIFFIILKLNKKLDLNISTKNALLITLSIIMIYNPLIVFDIGFQYSGLVTFGLIVSTKYYKKNYFYNLFITSFIALLFSVPITLYNNYELNLLSILNNLINVPLITFVIYPLSLLTFLLKFLEPIYNLTINLLEFINNISSIFSLNIIVPKVHIIFYLIYYLLIYLYIESNNKKYILIACLYLLSFKLKPFIDRNNYVYYLDVGQGDSSLIIYNDIVVMNDTGGTSNYNVSSGCIKLLKSLGYSHIDYLILTHGDFDHMGDSIYLINNYKVKNVVLNNDSFNELETNLIKELKKKKIKYYQNVEKIPISNNIITILNTEEYDNENDNSNVIYIELNNYNFMFMGDAGVDKEKDILERYNIPNIDVLKVGHHGSKTSSSKSFINKIKPKYSIISVGKNNRYGHPNKEVLNNLDHSKIYRTDEDGSIMFKIKNNKLKIETCSP
ncbi:MAG: DNA internalization-related competence protein ComEC/Rec2 [Tenericutes bacterium]|nr:DNA internalization-related competence protein ComEC/Rec2 [Mycoplasmatota bacterium]